MSEESSTDQWSIDVSDDEKYGNNLIRDGKITKWQPSPNKIALLYQQLEKNGSLDLKWKCPGRRSPSVHSPSSAANNILERNKVNSIDSNKSSNSLATEFEFDEKFGDTSPSSTVTTVNRRKVVNKGSRKVAKLENVMNNLKKYQIMDSQTKKSDINVTNPQSTQVNNSVNILTTSTTALTPSTSTSVPTTASASTCTSSATSTDSIATATSALRVASVEQSNISAPQEKEGEGNSQMDSQ